MTKLRRLAPQWQGRKPNRYISNWETIAVTALPDGWRNWYRHDDGTVSANDCPALLMQELRSVTACWDNPPQGVHTEDRHEDKPYDVRVIAADFGYGDGTLSAVDEVSNYIGTFGPGDELPRDGPPPAASSS